MKLSEHFSQEEFEASDTAIRFGLENRMSATELDNATRLCLLILEQVRREFGAVHINSGYRSPEVNEKVGSKPTSQHTKGLAADITIQHSIPLVVCQWIASSSLPFDQVIHEYGRWCHVSIPWAGATPRKMTLTIDKTGTRTGLYPVTA